jgi:D-alanyl-D-alanine carboxypeptidase
VSPTGDAPFLPASSADLAGDDRLGPSGQMSTAVAVTTVTVKGRRRRLCDVTPPRSSLARRRVFVALVASLLVVLGLALAFTPHGSPSTGAVAAPPAHGAAPPDPTAPIPPAWLAWTSGGFPADFRAHIRTLDPIARAVVVAGDTRWMTASHDARGEIIDRPTPPYAIPLDAFAVNPTEYAPFLPQDLREAITSTLRAGEAVLGSSSADLRRIGPGGSVDFGTDTVEVGLVAPDDVVGWSELLVSRGVGRRLGIVDDRYLLAQLRAGSRRTDFTAGVGSLVPAGTPIRVVPPGGTSYVRVASGVNPPVVIKEVFGEFSAFPQPGDAAYLTMDTGWSSAHIATRSVPLLGQVTCNRALFPPLIAALREIERQGLSSLIHSDSGCYAARTVARSPTAPPSQHAYGAAIDINAPENPYGATPTMDPRIVRIFRSHGFLWGGAFLIPDGMHFEYGAPDPSA